MRIALLPLLAAACSPVVAEVPVQRYALVGSFPHDSSAYTQGLFFHRGALYESTGVEGRSAVRKVRLDTGEVLAAAQLPADQFGEGSVGWGDQIISITWQEGVGHRWDAATLRHLGSFRYPGEGWGLTQDGANLIMSDGTSYLRFLDPATFEERERVQVTVDGKPLTQINELEYVRGEILANVWMTDRIARIDPNSGAVTGWIDLTGIAASDRPAITDAVLNGIAYDAASDRLFVTGKLWPKLYEIKLAPAGR